ncbi:lipoate--protein ligase family protein [Amycolatopsis roodepoortensis]|uniref:Lipoate-protein ligase A n=1 Tax=Amycolatopsis roodepoortensis TaxID=700274 RepID=A0ABR9KXR7_9PSEU|nr:lipoate--protein ligase family protein [Amycolatopsis roodepoortensis]MBE1573149.1 lipoate-protein ligase A [Amycolatopsis roodepoortensis]
MTGPSEVVASFDDPADNLAFDEALLRAAPEAPVLWIWRNTDCVVVGRGQKIEREVKADVCASDGVPVLRRASGGGTVFHDPGNLNITLVLPGLGLSDKSARPLEALGELMTATVAELGLPSRLGDRGLFVGDAKLCGFAVFRTRTGLLAHSTLLVSTASERVGRYLTSAPADPRPLDSHRSPVASLAEHGLRKGVAEVTAAVRVAAAAQLGELSTRKPSAEELERHRSLQHTRYHYPEWHAEGAQRPAS